ncbi:MAG: GNAT family N-acetyltransferase [Pseudomonadota bacterium]
MSEDRTIETIVSPSAAVSETLALAFQDDPALVWIQPDPEARRQMLPKFFKVAAEQSHRYGGVLASRPRSAASLWYPPGRVKDGGFWDSLRLLTIFKTTLPRGLNVAEAMHARHPSPQPYSYLRYVGVAPSAQGQGWGGAVIREGIGRAARQGLGVLLETATESNVAIYSRLGFSITAEWDVPGGGPRFWTMVREAE